MSTMPSATFAQVVMVRRNMGYSLPLLSRELPELGEMIGMPAADATRAADTDAVEHPAPTIACTP
eukprot:6618493-Prymnesium_polylepis.1